MYVRFVLARRHSYADNITIEMTPSMNVVLERTLKEASVTLQDTHLMNYSMPWFCDCLRRHGRPCIVPYTCCTSQYIGHCPVEQRLVRLNSSWCDEERFKELCMCKARNECYLPNAKPGNEDGEIVS